MTSAVFLAILCLGLALAVPTPDYNLDTEWEEWKRSNQRTYSPVGHTKRVPVENSRSYWIFMNKALDATPTREEEKQRRAVWEENIKLIKQHIVENGLWMNNFTLEMNEFGDMTGEEMRKMMTESSSLTLRNGKHIQKRNVKIPKTLDWRKEGYVTPVRSQGRCGACWAFSVTACIESQLYKKTGKLIPLSVQNLMDCSVHYGTNGCLGGKPYTAFQYVKNSGGLEAEATYPYEAKVQKCRYRPERSVVKVTRFFVVPRNEEALMQALVTHGPIAVAIDGSHESFSKYRGGIYYEPECKHDTLDHGLLLVGYGYEGHESENRKYWLLKNSYGEAWGEKGYMKLPRGQNNYCGIASYAMYPVL